MCPIFLNKTKKNYLFVISFFCFRPRCKLVIHHTNTNIRMHHSQSHLRQCLVLYWNTIVAKKHYHPPPFIKNQFNRHFLNIVCGKTITPHHWPDNLRCQDTIIAEAKKTKSSLSKVSERNR